MTGHDCEAVLTGVGWTAGGAGPNYWCVYMNKGAQRIVVASTIVDPVTPLIMRGIMSSLKADENAAGRRMVLVYCGTMVHGLAEDAAAEGLICIRFDYLNDLDLALSAMGDAAAARRAADLHSLTRAYDPPEPAAMLRVAPGTSNLILSTDLVDCFFCDRGGDRLVISFANQWIKPDGRAFWADQATKALGLSVLGFVAKEPCWYPADDMAALVPAALAPIAGRFPDRITYGHSQGGHAAIRYSRAFGARTVLAFSPQYAIDRRLVTDARVNGFYRGMRHAGMAITADDCAGTMFVFFDPNDRADREHAAHIGAAVPILTIPVPFTGHATDRGVGKPEAFAGLLEAAQTADRDTVRRFIAANRGARPDRAIHLALKLAARRPRTAAAILQLYGASWKPDQLMHVCYKMAVGGQAELAFGAAAAAAAANPDNAHVQGTAGLIALQLRQLTVAHKLIERALELDLGNPKWLNAEQKIRDIGTGRAA